MVVAGMAFATHLNKKLTDLARPKSPPTPEVRIAVRLHVMPMSMNSFQMRRGFRGDLIPVVMVPKGVGTTTNGSEAHIIPMWSRWWFRIRSRLISTMAAEVGGPLGIDHGNGWRGLLVYKTKAEAFPGDLLAEPTPISLQQRIWRASHIAAVSATASKKVGKGIIGIAGHLAIFGLHRGIWAR